MGKLLDRYFTMTESRNIPMQAFIELSWKCNELCKHCYLSVEGRRQGSPGDHTTEQVKSLLDQLADAGCLYVVFTGGEVLLRRDFFDIVEHARRRRFAVVVFTNGTLVSDRVADRFAALDVAEVDISVYSHLPDTHDWVTNVPGSFAMTVSGIRRLRARGVKVKMKVPVMKVNLDHIDGLRALAESLGAEIKFDPIIVPMNTGSEVPLECRLDDAGLETALRKLSAPGREAMFTAGGDAMCNAGKNTLGISPEGEVYPCLQLLMSWGNVHRRPFQEIWQGGDKTPFRETRPEDIHGCHDCGVKSHCARCPGLALLENGDWRGPSTAACQAASVRAQLAVERTAQGEPPAPLRFFAKAMAPKPAVLSLPNVGVRAPCAV